MQYIDSAKAKKYIVMTISFEEKESPWTVIIYTLFS